MFWRDDNFDMGTRCRLILWSMNLEDDRDLTAAFGDDRLAYVGDDKGSEDVGTHDELVEGGG